MLIRDTTSKDMVKIQDIYAHHVKYGRASWEETPPSLDEITLRHDSILAEGFPYLVAEEDGQVHGFAFASK